MSNRIVSLSFRDDLTDPTCARTNLSVYPERLTSQTDVRGRLMGPRCAYAATVEVALPFRPFSQPDEAARDPRFGLQVLIPEPSLWEPETPFLYQGVVELWEKGERCDRVQFQRGLRDLKLGPRGLRLNGRPFTIRGLARDRFFIQDLPGLRQAGFNTLVYPLLPESAELWTAADRLGFLMLGQIASGESILRNQQWDVSPSLLGYLVAAEAKELEILSMLATCAFAAGDKPRVGWALTQSPPAFFLEECDFVYCAKELLPALAGLLLPKLIRTDSQSLETEEFKKLVASPGIMGWVVDPSPHQSEGASG